MPPFNFMGLSGLGMTQPSASGATDDSQHRDLLGEMLGKPNQILDEYSKSRMLEQMLAQEKSRPQQSGLDQLASPQGLIALLGTLAAGAIGGAPAAAGFGLGALGGASGQAEAKRSQQRAAIEELNKRYEKSLDQLDKSQQRVATLFNTNPEAFIDPVTGEQTVSPDVLGFYTTGVPMKLFAGTRRVMNRRDSAWENRHNMLTKALETTTDFNDRKTILQAAFQNMDWTAPPEVVNALATASPEQIKPELVNTFLRYGGASALDALATAGENGWDHMDPRVLRMIQFKDPEASASKVTPSDRFLQLANEINDWSTNPDNLDRMREIRAEAGPKGEDAVSIAIAREVLGGRAGDFAIYRDEAELRNPDELSAIMAQYKIVRDKYKLGVGLSGINKTDALRNMDEDEQNAFLWGAATDAYQGQLQQQRDDQAKQDVALANGVATRLQREAQVGPAEAAQAAKEIAATALRRATRPDGSVDRTRYEQELRKVTDEVLAGTQAAE